MTRKHELKLMIGSLVSWIILVLHGSSMLFLAFRAKQVLKAKGANALPKPAGRNLDVFRTAVSRRGGRGRARMSSLAAPSFLWVTHAIQPQI